MIKASIKHEEITLINIYVPNIGAPKEIKQISLILQGEIDSTTVIVGDFNTPLSELDS